MQSQLDNFARSLNLPLICCAAVLLMIGWSVFCVYAQRKMRIIGAVTALLSAALILFVTLLSRTKIASPSVYLTPFSTFERGQLNGDLFIFMILNVCLFVPFGASLPFVIRGKAWKKLLFTILSGLLFSFIIESLQNLFSVGYMDIDDIISNTLGTIIGSSTYLLYLQMKKNIKKAKRMKRTAAAK